MSFRGQARSPYHQARHGNPTNSSKQDSPQQDILLGWGTPARGYSPSKKTRGPNPSPRAERPFHSPASNYSPKHLNFNSPAYNSPQFMNLTSPGYSQHHRYPSPCDTRFKTPHSPFSPPGSRGHGNCGRKNTQNYYRNYNQVGHNSSNERQSLKWETFSQTPRQDRNCNPGGSSNIEDYFHPSMLHDPWKFCTSVPVTHTPSSSLTT